MAAGQGHAYAMLTVATIHWTRTEYQLSVEWTTKAAESGLPDAMYTLGCCLDEGKGMAAPDHLAAAGWYRRAADAGDGDAASNLAAMYSVGRGRAW